jgi:hypothetical protein
MIGIHRAQFQPRAPRVNLWGIVSASLQLENGRQFTGKLQTLSITGGLLDVATFFDERTNISLLFRFAGVILQTRAQLLFPMRGGMGYLQPFRFTGIGMKERQIIDAEINTILKKAAAEKTAQGLGYRPPRSYLDLF